jgi:uncharacterized membrane protein (UPF0127 family)
MTRRFLPALMLSAATLAVPVALSLASFGTVPALAQTAAQAELPHEKLTIVGKDGTRHDFDVEMAVTPEQQTVGLMFRRSVPANGGMLFDWGRAQDSQMWMRNTVTSLDMVFINPDGTIRRVAENTVPESLAIVASGGPVRATLELAAGTARRLNIHAGDKVEQRIFQR